MINHNEFSRYHHQNIIRLGYWTEPRELGTLLMLIVTEVSKLFDENRLNRSEKLADVSLRLYDLLSFYNIDLSVLPDVDSCSYNDMINMLVNELEAERSGIHTNHVYLKQCLSMVWLYAKNNNIDLESEIIRKSQMILSYSSPTKKF